MTAINYQPVIRKLHFGVSSFTGEMAHFPVGYVSELTNATQRTEGEHIAYIRQ